MDTAEFVQHFRQTFPDLVGSRILVALSGGRDSVALLHLLREPALGLELVAAHVHHGLRGGEADADAAFCVEICRVLGTPCQVLRLPEDDLLPASGEAAWRRRRYRALLECAAEVDAAAVATAHHRDDVAEGVLVQLLRGAGPRAMAGIEARTRDGVIRPLLPWGRNAVTDWLESAGISWREDSSNRDLSMLRNLVRHRVLPDLSAQAPSLREHLVHLAGALADGESFMAAETAARVGFADPWEVRGGVPLDDLRNLPPALRSRWFHGQIAALGLGPATRRQLELFASLLDEGVPRSVTISGRWCLRAARGRVWAEPPQAPRGVRVELRPGVPVELGIPGWMAGFGTSGGHRSDARWRWSPAHDASVISVRPTGPSDLLPRSGRKPARARELIAELVPRHLRFAWPAFCEDDMIHWIPGVWRHPGARDSSIRVVEVYRR